MKNNGAVWLGCLSALVPLLAVYLFTVFLYPITDFVAERIFEGLGMMLLVIGSIPVFPGFIVVLLVSSILSTHGYKLPFPAARGLSDPGTCLKFGTGAGMWAMAGGFLALSFSPVASFEFLVVLVSIIIGTVSLLLAVQDVMDWEGKKIPQS